MEEIILVIGILFLIINLFMFFFGKKVENEVKEQNKAIFEENNTLRSKRISEQKEYEDTRKLKENAEKDLNATIKLIDEKQLEFRRENEKLKELKENVENVYKDKEEMSQKAFENFCDVLSKDYEEKSNNYDELIFNLDKTYNDKQSELLKKLESITAEIEDMKRTRAAAIEAQIREKQIKADMSFYCLIPSVSDLQDYDKINSLRPMLNNGRALSMLLWQTYYQPLAKKQFPQILGTSAAVTGIYKITNQITNQCYIGQALSIDSRWKDHCKAGLGIDTPAGNKLYKAMQEYGLQNFSFEVLERCEKEQLNEKEKFYIELYDTYNFGYNSNKGVGKK